MARRQAVFTDLLEFSAKLPWQVAAGLAVASFAVLHVVAVAFSSPVAATSIADIGKVVIHSGIHTLAYFLQFFMPVGFAFGAVASVIMRSRSAALMEVARANPGKSLASMRWRDFERLVGEGFRQRGYAVTGFGGSGPDGGVDLGLAKNGERYLVQCKYWRNRQVGITVVRELNGVIVAQGAHGGFAVTGGEFTREAQVFAEKTKIELIDGKALQELIRSAPTSAAVPKPAIK